MRQLPDAPKRCPKCATTKFRLDFALSNRTPDGVQGVCKECRKEAHQLNAPKIRERMRDHYIANSERLKAAARDRYARKPEELREASRARYHALPTDDKRRVAQRAAIADKRSPGKAAHRVALRRSRLKCATPAWLDANHISQIKAFYVSADGLNMLTGEWHEVDHIVPIRGKTVCGLHVPWNLQILPASENARKLNTNWPNKP